MAELWESKRLRTISLGGRTRLPQKKVDNNVWRECSSYFWRQLLLILTLLQIHIKLLIPPQSASIADYCPCLRDTVTWLRLDSQIGIYNRLEIFSISFKFRLRHKNLESKSNRHPYGCFDMLESQGKPLIYYHFAISSCRRTSRVLNGCIQDRKWIFFVDGLQNIFFIHGPELHRNIQPN